MSATPQLHACPACGASSLEEFFAERDVPVHSCRLLSRREDALAFPLGALRLAVCRSCGFVTNSAYDPSLQDYAESYEETQGFSPRFQQFADALARRLISRHDIRNRDVLEIGCGKGEFLLLLCELGGNRGVGIDPSFVPERVPSATAEQVTFIRDYYGPRYADLTGDLVVCRHTLEHIQPVGEFVRLLRRSLNDRPDTVVFFEVPDTMRVFREPAFWDIYYEHCSYFTCGSLARLFRASGFDVLDVWLDYEDQYVMLECRPTTSQPSPPLPAEESVEEIVQAALGYPVRAAEGQARWRAALRSAAAADRPVALWGSGSKAVSFLTTLRIAEEVACVVDVNPYKHGKFTATTGHPIVAPEELPRYAPGVVVAMNGIYRAEIQADLDRLSITADLLTLDDRIVQPA